MSNNIYEKLRKVTWKHWILFLLLSQAIYIIMLTQTIPSIQQEAGGMKIFDLHPFGYSYDYAYRFLSQLSEKGYKLYKLVQLPLDILYPILNCFTGIFTLVLLLRIYHMVNAKHIQQKYSIFAKIMLFLPLAAMLFDYLENIMILVMLSYQALVPQEFILVSNSFTIIKSMTTTGFYSICLGICISIGILWINKKVKREKTIE